MNHSPYRIFISQWLCLFVSCVSVNVFHSHENSSGYYRTSVYFLSKIFADLIPNRIIPIFVFSAIAYYMMGNFPGYKHTPHIHHVSAYLANEEKTLMAASHQV